MQIPVPIPARRAPVAVWLAIATGLAAPLWAEAVAPTHWSRALSFEPSLAGAVFLTAIVAGTIHGIRSLWGAHCALAAAAVVFTGAAVVTNVDLQAIGSFVLAATSLVLLVLPAVARYEVKRLRSPRGKRPSRRRRPA